MIAARMPANKYRAKRMTVDGITFASKREATHYALLKRQERLGLIRNLELQPRFRIVIDGRQVRYPGSNRPMTYVGDFSFMDDTGRRILDVKGLDTPASKIKRALVEHIYHVKIEVVK